MNRRIICALILLPLVTLRAAHAGVITGPIVNPANSHTYFLLAQDSWTNSESQAKALGGHLATINDASEQSWVFSTFGNDRNLWIGLYDPTLDSNGGHTNNFVWASGEPVNYFNWGNGEPNNANSGEYWVHMWGNNSDVARDTFRRGFGSWNDLNDSGFLTVDHVSGAFGVVEIVPEPGSLALLILGNVLMLRRRERSRVRDTWTR